MEDGTRGGDRKVADQEIGQAVPFPDPTWMRAVLDGRRRGAEGAPERSDEGPKGPLSRGPVPTFYVGPFPFLSCLYIPPRHSTDWVGVPPGRRLSPRSLPPVSSFPVRSSDGISLRFSHTSIKHAVNYYDNERFPRASAPSTTRPNVCSPTDSRPPGTITGHCSPSPDTCPPCSHTIQKQSYLVPFITQPLKLSNCHL